MNPTDSTSLHAHDSPTGSIDQLAAPIAAACARIAPTWPLDRFIAVNPYWGHLDQPIADAAAQLACLSGSPMVMPRAWWRAQWKAGRIDRTQLAAAIEAAGSSRGLDEMVAELDAPSTADAALPLATDLVDATRDLRHAMSWRDYTTHHISQRCAAWFDEGQAAWSPSGGGGLYASWLRESANDFGPALLMGHTDFAKRVGRLPHDPHALIAAAVAALGLPVVALAPYFTALLTSINGWSAWCAHRRWQARLVQQDDDQIVHLLAVRLAWEWLLHQANPSLDIAPQLSAAWTDFESSVAQTKVEQETYWLWQDALERTFQAPLCDGLMEAPASNAASQKPPAVQAVFCIDVRSEVFRRALEASSPAVQTRGFAGFFAMSLAYQPLGSDMVRPQLPGLLSPALCITDACDTPGLGQVLALKRSKNLRWRQQWSAFRGSAASTFSFVESCGIAYAGQLFKRSRPNRHAQRPVEQTGWSDEALAQLRPRLPDASAADKALRVDWAANALGAMGLVKGLARLVLLAGHGSTSTNNPHAAGLDCGACGGQTGEVNARALALLLNDSAVRRELATRGIELPESTCFVAGLHDTTTDNLRLFDTDLLPASHADDVRQLRAWLLEASRRARAERAPTLGLQALTGDAAALHRALAERSADWAQVRPEWGLADNAAFIVAPRSRSRHLDLAGRSFLHDYAWQEDEGFKVLELIMTAPMVVTNWINLQYHASTVDNPRYGSGNKLLHNVVGGHLGVFEGNGGDLRIGLPMQSLHDGTDWRHTPLRLSVFVQAPQAAIDDIVARHAVVRQLVDHGWLHLFRLDDLSGVWRCLRGGRWEPAACVVQALDAVEGALTPVATSCALPTGATH